MKLYGNVYQVKMTCCVQLWLLSTSSFLSNGPLVVVMLILDIFMKLYGNVYQAKMTCCVQLWLPSISSFLSNGPLVVCMLM